MERQHLIDFARRDWQGMADGKVEHWRERQQRLGPAEGIRVAEGLRRWVHEVRPDWPSAADREADLANHVRVGEMLRRVELG